MINQNPPAEKIFGAPPLLEELYLRVNYEGKYLPKLTEFLIENLDLIWKSVKLLREIDK